MAVQKLLAIDGTGGYHVEIEPTDTIQLGGVGIGVAPSATGINLTGGDLTITGTAGIDISGTTGVITGLVSNPAGATDAVSKAYVDSLVSGVTWEDPVHTMEMIDDSLSAEPGAPADGDSYVTAGQSGGPYSITAANTGTETFTVTGDHSGLGAGDLILVENSTGNDGYWTVVSTSGTGPTDITVSEDVTDATGDGDVNYCDPGDAWDTVGPLKVVTYDGSAWDEIVTVAEGVRVVCKETGCAGSFSGDDNSISEYTSGAWVSTAPANGAAVIVYDHDPDGFHDNLGFTYSDAATDWVQFTGAGQINAGNGLTKSGNTLHVGQGNGITVSADAIAANPHTTSGVSVTASGIAVTPHTATDGTAVVLADTDEILIADADDSWGTKRVDMTQIQDYVSSAGLDSDLTDGNGIADFTYNGSSAASVAVDITNATDGTSLTLANDDEFLFADADDSNAVKKTTLAKIQDAVAAENGDLTDGNGIVDFTYDGSSAASITVQTVSTDRITVGASGIDVAGVPATFLLAGSAVSSNVTQTNVDLLVDGTATAATFNDATALHGHNCIWDTINADTNGVTADSAVIITDNDKVEDGESDSTEGARVVGVTLDTATDGNPARVVFEGIAPGVLTGATAGTSFFLQADGTLGTTLPTGASRRIIRVGIAKNATDLIVHIVDYGARRAT